MTMPRGWNPNKKDSNANDKSYLSDDLTEDCFVCYSGINKDGNCSGCNLKPSLCKCTGFGVDKVSTIGDIILIKN